MASEWIGGFTDIWLQASVHFLWQATAVALVALLASVTMQRSLPGTRYLAYASCLFALPALFVTTFAVLQHQASYPAVAEIQPTTTASANRSLTARQSTSVMLEGPATAASEPEINEESIQSWNASVYCFLAYQMAVGLLLLRLARSIYKSQSFYRSGTPIDDPVLSAHVRRQCSALRLRRAPRLATNEVTLVPLVVG